MKSQTGEVYVVRKAVGASCLTPTLTGVMWNPPSTTLKLGQDTPTVTTTGRLLDGAWVVNEEDAWTRD